jgi:hypothetical protein
MRLKEFDISVPIGSRGPDWVDLQKAFVSLGYDLKKFGIDGTANPELRKVISQFERDHKLTINGSPDAEMVNLINKIMRDKNINFPKSTEADIKPKVQTPTKFNPKALKSNPTDLGSVDQAIKFFTSKGYTPAQTAGIIGNLKAESGPNLNHRVGGDGGRAYGIAQWHPPRQATFKRVFGKDIRNSSFQEQLEFIDWELKNTELRAGQMLSKARTPKQAAIIFDKYYERSAGLHTKQRVAYAQEIEPKFT